jgi:hypothetical protein
VKACMIINGSSRNCGGSSAVKANRTIAESPPIRMSPIG